MGFFDRFKRKDTPKPVEKPERSASGAGPDGETRALVLLGRDVGWKAVVKAVEDQFGPSAVTSVDRSVPKVPAMFFQLEDVEFFCSYMAMPHPQGFSEIQEGLFSGPEREEMLAHQCFLVLVQRGGGQTLAEKRRTCRLFTRLAGALVSLDGAAGVYLEDAELLVSRRNYLNHASILEKNWEDPEYFPVPVWVGIRSGWKGELHLVGTWGLKQFGFLELWFLGARSPWPELHEKLYLMSLFQITGQELYQDTDTIEFTPGSPSVFKELNGALFIVGGGV